MVWGSTLEPLNPSEQKKRHSSLPCEFGTRAQEDVDFISTLVNAYRAGELILASELTEAQLAEDGAMQIIAVRTCQRFCNYANN